VRLSTYGHDGAELRGAVDRLLADESLRQRLETMSARLQTVPGTTKAADLIERIAIG
jgi:UDP:flavonoid glycosyltransferase YjiC (YdhE family)